MNQLVKKLFNKCESVATYSNPIFNAVYESIYQAIRNENAHRLQPPGNTPNEFYRFCTDMSHDLQGQIKTVVNKLIQNANDAANGGIFLNDLPGTVPFTIKNGEVVYIASWNVEALKLKARLSCEYNITALRNSLDFVYQQNPITATEKWVWQCHKSLILSHLSYADQIIGIADFLNGIIRHQQNCGKPIKDVRSIRDDLQFLTIHQLEVWIRENTEGLKNAIQPDAIMQVYAAICDIRNNMICKDELREIGLNTNAILGKLQIDQAEIGKHIDRNHNEILTTIKSALESLRGEVELPDLLENIDPERHKKDARIYCARLACYVWSNLNKSKRTCVDYVFREAKEGSRLYADCKLARAYMQKFSFLESSVTTLAAVYHAKENHFKHDDKISRPESMREAAKKSAQKELKALKQQKRRKR